MAAARAQASSVGQRASHPHGLLRVNILAHQYRTLVTCGNRLDNIAE